MRLFPLAVFAALCSNLLMADNVLHPVAPVLDPSTLTAIGIQLPLTGDDNYNAAVTVRYRETGTSLWRAALPLFRVHPESVAGWTIAPQFAGTIFDLRPATIYDIELHATDPDGPVDQIFTLSASTRPVPSDPQNPRAIAVHDMPTLVTALQAAHPGDVINLADGVYTGTPVLLASGTAQNPIVIRGTTRDGTIIDGGGCSPCNIWEIYGNYVHLERMTLRNAERAIRFQTAGATDNVVRRIHISNTRLAIGARENQRDFYICDNVAEGRLLWPQVYGSDNALHSNDDGIQVQGFGHVVCHNRISGYADAMQTAQDGARAIDFYGNDVLFTYDNGIELDGSEGNARCFRNRFTNGWDTLSLQPIHGGPAYLIRNVVVNSADEQMKFHALNLRPPPEPNGVLAYHNTFISTATDLNMNTPDASHHFAIENNLFVGPPNLPGKAVSWTGVIDDGRFDYNGYLPDGFMTFNLLGTGYRNFPNFAAAQNGGFEPHGLLLGGQPFAIPVAIPSSYATQMAPLDLTLASGSSAVDRGLPLANINDGFTGNAPDLGALEVGCPKPIYGPRPEGIDESNEPFGCVVSTATPVGPPPNSGLLKICAVAGAGSFNIGGTTVTVSADSCAAAMSLPAGGVIIKETPAAGIVLSSVVTSPAGLLADSNLAASTATITVLAGAQITVTFIHVIQNPAPLAGPAGAFQVFYQTNPDTADSSIKLTNTGASGGNVCVSAYTFSSDEQLTSCCSCLITPNALVSLLTPGAIKAVVKLLASFPDSGSTPCDPSTPVAARLTPALLAWGVNLHALPPPSPAYGITESPFLNATLSPAELTTLTSLCGQQRANSNGSGICGACREN